LEMESKNTIFFASNTPAPEHVKLPQPMTPAQRQAIKMIRRTANRICFRTSCPN
jgi:hypothetical protein